MTRRVLFSGLGNILGHVTRSAVIAEALRTSTPGIRMEFAMGGAFSSFAAQHGLVSHDVDPLFPRQNEPGRGRGDEPEAAMFRLLVTVKRAFGRAMHDDMAVLASVRPDLVVSDHRWSMVLAANRLGIPCFGITNAIYTRWSSPTSAAVAELLEQQNEAIRRLLGKELREAGWEHDVTSLFVADRPMLTDLPELGMGTPAALRDTVGPMPWNGGPAVVWPSGSGPAVYISAGSTGDARLLTGLARLLSERGWRVVVTGTGATSRDRMVAVDFACADKLLATADLAVVHGGSGSVYQAIRWAVPALLTPTNLDQLAHAEAMARFGAGELADNGDVDRMAEQCADLLADRSRREKCESLAQAMASQNGPRSAAELIASSLS